MNKSGVRDGERVPSSSKPPSSCTFHLARFIEAMAQIVDPGIVIIQALSSWVDDPITQDFHY